MFWSLMDRIKLLVCVLAVGIGCSLIGFPIALFSGDYALIGWSEKYDEIRTRINVNYLNFSNCNETGDITGLKNCKDVKFADEIDYKGECWRDRDEQERSIAAAKCDYVYDNKTTRVMIIGGSGENCASFRKRFVDCYGSIEEAGECIREFEAGFIPEKIYVKSGYCYRSMKLGFYDIYFACLMIFAGMVILGYVVYKIKLWRRNSKRSVDMMMRSMGEFNNLADTENDVPADL